MSRHRRRPDYRPVMTSAEWVAMGLAAGLACLMFWLLAVS